MFPTHKRPQTKTRLPFTRTQLSKAGLPPPGRYNFIIRDAQVSPGAQDDKLVVDFEVAGGPEDGRVVRQWYSLAPYQREALWILYEKARALEDETEELTAEQLIGTAISADFSEEIGGDGRSWARLEKIDVVE